MDLMLVFKALHLLAVDKKSCYSIHLFQSDECPFIFFLPVKGPVYSPITPADELYVQFVHAIVRIWDCVVFDQSIMDISRNIHIPFHSFLYTEWVVFDSICSKFPNAVKGYFLHISSIETIRVYKLFWVLDIEKMN